MPKMFWSDLNDTNNQFENSQIEFTLLGNNLVYNSSDGWKVYLLACYNQYYIPPREVLNDDDTRMLQNNIENVTEGHLDELIHPNSYVKNYIPAHVGTC